MLHTLPAGLLLITAVGNLLRVVLPDGWTAAAQLLAAVALLGLARGRLRQGFLVASGAAQAVVLTVIASLSLAEVSSIDRKADLVVLSALTLLGALVSTRPGMRTIAVPATLVYATTLICTTSWEPHHTALLLLLVPAAAALLAAKTAPGGPGLTSGLAVELVGAAAAALALSLATTDGPTLALTLALLGVIASGTAVRPDRRAAVYVATALFLLATWVRLATWQVDLVEAYTLPAALPALLLGTWHRRRTPALNSWTAYGPGLTTALLPSLAATWTDPSWQRPLLLGMAALSLTLLGGAHRLQSPLLLGGGVLLLDALHELTPYLAQLAGTLPRWAPPALAGALLLTLGATYERRLRDVRRVRETLGRFN